MFLKSTCQRILKDYGGNDRLNMTLLASNLSKYNNGGTEAHMEYSRKLFPGYHIQEITNGVHSFNWTCPYFRALFDKYIPRWANKPELLVRGDTVPEGESWEACMKAKQELLNYVSDETATQMDADTLTIAFARRATHYKRVTMIFSDLERLREIRKQGRIQLIFAGKAHLRDQMGKQLIKEIYAGMDQLKMEIKIFYLENFTMQIDGKLLSGADVWLNTPLRPFKASGTSSMKAPHNGVINFRVSDGWRIERCVEGLNGLG